MGLGVAAAIGGLGSLLGGAQAQRAARKEAQRNRQFQERMRNTEWQAAVADMEAAGINPALAYSQGGASTPGGSMAAQQDFGTPAVSTAMQQKRLAADLKLIKAQEYAAAQMGQKTHREAVFQEIQNDLWSQGWRDGKREPGPLWNQVVANARSASEIWKGHVMNNTLLKNLADVARTPQGQSLGWLRYIMSSWKGR